MTDFDRQLDATLAIAAERARKERRWIAVHASAGRWSVAPPADETLDGHIKLCIVGPEEDTPEDRDFIVKCVYSSWKRGSLVIPKAIIESYGEPSDRWTKADVIPDAIEVPEAMAEEPSGDPAPEMPQESPTVPQDATPEPEPPKPPTHGPYAPPPATPRPKRRKGIDPKQGTIFD